MVQADDYLSVMQAMKVKGVTRASLYRAMDRGELVFSVIGEHRVIRRKDLDAYTPRAYGGKPGAKPVGRRRKVSK